MCYPKPGPRCSFHAREKLKRLQKANASEAEVREATKDYLETPEGIRKLRDAGKTDLASVMMSRRKRKIDDYKRQQQEDQREFDEEYLSWAENQATVVLADEFGEDYARKTVNTIREFQSRGYAVLGGRTRVAFDDGTNILKVPITSEGVSDCGQEVRVSKQDDAYTPMAHTEWRDTDDGISYTVSEKVKPYQGDIDVLPKWTYAVDCFQVGHTRDGRLVAYDL